MSKDKKAKVIKLSDHKKNKEKEARQRAIKRLLAQADKLDW